MTPKSKIAHTLQRILVFQQNGSGESKIAGLHKYGGDSLVLESISITRIGLETQYVCSADPAGWDPIHGKSPVHLAGDIHRNALIRALKRGSAVRT